MKVTLGGDRLGSGNKNKIALHNYERSTHNLSQKFTSSLQCGTLYPFLCIPGMRGDKFEIDLDADARTIPTKGPLFGSFKMQVDLFQCDVRLYQAILHNNPLAIGLKMNQVMFPTLKIRDNKNTNAFSNSCLLKYLGLSGIGTDGGQPEQIKYINRTFNAIPALAYYEIFKTYYANKQEEQAYLIGTEEIEANVTNYMWSTDDDINDTKQIVKYNQINDYKTFKVYDNLYIDFDNYDGNIKEASENIWVNFYDENDDYIGAIKLSETQIFKYLGKSNNKYIYQYIKQPVFPSTLIPYEVALSVSSISGNGEYTYKQRGLEPFTLSNIDDMRLALLSKHTLGTPFEISNFGNADWDENSGTDQSGKPYINLVNLNGEKTRNADPLNGLVVKTYQSDLYNNWINTEWIDGENGIANVTAISTESGSIKIDSLNLSEKLYNMLNRIAVSDGSYEGWQDAVYTETPKRHIESPVYLGGMSSEIMFEEIVQTAPADGNPLGTLGGKGKLIKRKGGRVVVKCNEACFIIGIVSLTPRINYTQGNEWYLTDLKSMDDFHKPALDGIGFQNLIAERAAWWDTKIGTQSISRHNLGKVPAWIEYMTAVDKSYGDFAENEGRGFMSLNREYGRTENNEIQDATTYIDPRKFNYAFAYTDIDAQNFWIQIYSKIKARRLMSAKQIPTI